jgi:class 3 adenylate cyclase
LGCGIYETIEGDQVSYHGEDLDLLYRVCDWCPPGGILVTESMFSLLEDAKLGYRFHERRERLKGFGLRVFYQSNGDYRAPKPSRWPRFLQRVK